MGEQKNLSNWGEFCGAQIDQGAETLKMHPHPDEQKSP